MTYLSHLLIRQTLQILLNENFPGFTSLNEKRHCDLMWRNLLYYPSVIMFMDGLYLDNDFRTRFPSFYYFYCCCCFVDVVVVVSGFVSLLFYYFTVLLLLLLLLLSLLLLLLLLYLFIAFAQAVLNSEIFFLGELQLVAKGQEDAFTLHI